MPKAGKDNSNGENKPGYGRVFPRGGGIRELTKIQCGIRATLPRYGIRLLPWKWDSPKFGEENDIRNSNDGSSGRGILVEKRRESGIRILPFQILIYHWNEVVPFLKPNVSRPRHLCVRNL